MKNEIIINFTPTGMIPTKSMTPHIPVSVTEIVEDFHRAFELGITKKISVSEYFNKSTIKFKAKLNSKHLKLYLDINLFNIFKKCYLLRRYS